MIKLVTDTIDKDDINYLIEWLKTEPRLTKGEVTKQFEDKWSDWLSPSEKVYSVYVNSGSSANLLMTYAMKAMNQLKNDRIVVPAVSWATTVAPVMQFGLEPILCDADKDTLAVDVEHLEKIFIEDSPAAMILVHALGFAANMEKITELCEKYDVILLEDSCETVGSTFKGNKTGTFGLVSTFSFYFGHHISTIEGGMVCTKDEDVYKTLLMLRSHGWDRDLPDEDKKHLRELYSIDEFNSMYSFYHPGFNLRSTDLQAYIGLRQIDKLDYICQRRHENFMTYDTMIKNNYWKVSPWQTEHPDIISNFAYPIIHPNSKDIAKALGENDIEVRPLICGSMSKQPFFVEIYGEDKMEFADEIHEYGLYVPNHAALSDDDIKKIANIVNEFTEG